jgi:hypothetical protein
MFGFHDASQTKHETVANDVVLVRLVSHFIARYSYIFYIFIRAVYKILMATDNYDTRVRQSVYKCATARTPSMKQ